LAGGSRQAIYGGEEKQIPPLLSAYHAHGALWRRNLAICGERCCYAIYAALRLLTSRQVRRSGIWRGGSGGGAEQQAGGVKRQA